MNPKPLPSQAQLKSLFDYNPDTGILTRIKGRLSALGPSGAKGKNGYLYVVIGGNNKFLVHRVIWKWMTGIDPSFIDHRDTDTENNRWGNLRECTITENAFNMSGRRDNKSGYKNISRPPRNESGWITQIVKNGIFHTRRTKTLAGAIAWRRLKSLQLCGEFSRLS